MPGSGPVWFDVFGLCLLGPAPRRGSSNDPVAWGSCASVRLSGWATQLMVNLELLGWAGVQVVV